jgi:hypothetical protein
MWALHFCDVFGPFCIIMWPYCSWVGAGEVQSVGYGLVDRAIQVTSPVGATIFVSNLVSPDRLWGPPSLLSNGYRGPFSGEKRGRDVTLTTHPHPVPRSWMSRSYISSPSCASINVLWDCFLLFMSMRQNIYTGIHTLTILFIKNLSEIWVILDLVNILYYKIMNYDVI